MNNSIRTLRAKILLPVSVVILFAAGTCFVFFNFRGQEIEMDKRMAELDSRSQQMGVLLSKEIETLVDDTRFLANTPPIQGLIRASKNRGTDPKDGSNLIQWKKRLQTIFKEMATVKPFYHEIKLILIDEGIRELVRIDNYDGAVVVEMSDRQVNWNNEFYSEIRKLSPDSVYIGAPFPRINQGVVVKPMAPQIQVAVPIFDGRKKFGAVALSFDFLHLQKELNALVGNELQWILNDREGRYLRSPKPNQAFNFVFEAGDRLWERFPELQSEKEINSKVGVSFSHRIGGDSILGVHRRIQFDPFQKDRVLGLTLFQDKDILLASSREGISSSMILLGFLSVFVGCFIFWRISGELYPIKLLIEGLLESGEEPVIPDSTLKNNTEIGILAATLRDVLYRLKQANREVKENSDLLESVVANAPNGIITIDQDGITKSYNRAAENIFGFRSEEMLGKNISKLMLPAEAEKHDQYIKSYLLSGRVGMIGKGIDLLAIKKDGSIFPVFITVAEIPGDDGKSLFSGIVRDLTAEKEIERRLKEEQARAVHASKLSSIGELAAGVGHEINNPLMIASGLGGRIKKKLEKTGEMDEEIRLAFDKQFNALERIRKIVDGLRTYARADKEDHSEFDLVECVEVPLNLVADIYQKEGVKIAFINKTEKPTLVFGNIGQVQQVVFNLLSNAKYAVMDSSNKEIELELCECGESYLLKVKDHGPGIPKEIQGKIFETFFTTKGPGQGTGIGLSLSAKLIKDHGGRIEFESSGNGTEFFLYLPKSKKAALDPQLSSPEPGKLLECPGYRILVVDDEEDLQCVLENTFLDLGCRVVKTADGEEAIEYLKEGVFDFVFTDIKMPGMDGFALIRRIQGLAVPRVPKIVLMTGGVALSKEEDQFQEVSNYIFGFLSKPFSLPQIMEIFKKANIQVS